MQTEAARGPVRRHLGHRLGLAWLKQAGIAERWQCRDFWKTMVESYRRRPPSNQPFQYRVEPVRTFRLFILLIDPVMAAFELEIFAKRRKQTPERPPR